MIQIFIKKYISIPPIKYNSTRWNHRLHSEHSFRRVDLFSFFQSEVKSQGEANFKNASQNCVNRCALGIYRDPGVRCVYRRNRKYGTGKTRSCVKGKTRPWNPTDLLCRASMRRLASVKITFWIAVQALDLSCERLCTKRIKEVFVFWYCLGKNFRLAMVLLCGKQRQEK